MIIPNQTTGVRRVAGGAIRFSAAVTPSREPTRHDWKTSCEDCGCSYSESRRREGGAEIITVSCACPSQAKRRCVSDKLDEIDKLLVLDPPTYDTGAGSGFGLPGYAADRYYADRASPRYSFPVSPVARLPRWTSFPLRRFG